MIDSLSFNTYQNPIVGSAHIKRLFPTTFRNWRIGAMGGFLDCSFDCEMQSAEAFWWMDQMLGSRLQITAQDAVFDDGIAWEGYVNDIEIIQPQIRRSLSDMWNNVAVAYSRERPNHPSYAGERTQTAWAGDTTSQALYGIKEMIHNEGGMRLSIAEDLRDRLLAYYAYPRVTFPKLDAFTMPGALTVRFGILGYWATLAWRPWTDGTEADENVSAIIANILTTSGQFISSDQSHIDTNAYQRSQFFANPLTMQKTIEGLCALGDSSKDAPYFFQVLENRKPWYFKQSSTADYVMHRDGSIRLSSSNVLVKPYCVRPGKVVEVVDLSPTLMSTSLADARFVLIGEVKYDGRKVAIAPMSGGGAVDVLLTQLGLRGGL